MENRSPLREVLPLLRAAGNLFTCTQGEIDGTDYFHLPRAPFVTEMHLAKVHAYPAFHWQQVLVIAQLLAERGLEQYRVEQILNIICV